jgi:hypothetical protein
MWHTSESTARILRVKRTAIAAIAQEHLLPAVLLLAHLAVRLREVQSPFRDRRIGTAHLCGNLTLLAVAVEGWRTSA